MTLNGLTIHSKVMSTLKKNIGHTIFYQLSKADIRLLLTTGGISAISWYTALATALTDALNFTVTYEQILLSYAVFCLLFILFLNIFLSLIFYFWPEFTNSKPTKK